MHSLLVIFLFNSISNANTLRVSQEAEDIGLNIAEHDSSSDQIDLLKIMQYQNDTGIYQSEGLRIYLLKLDRLDIITIF